MNNSQQIKTMVYTALFVALITIGSFIFIPIGPVPIVLQNMFVLLSAIILGPLQASICVGIYLLSGFAGLPVFAGGVSGLGKLVGPTGGYLIGYLPAVLVTGYISKTLGKKLSSYIIAMSIGSLFIYSIGVPWLMVVASLNLKKALIVGMYPFLIGDVLKIIAAAFIAKKTSPLLKQ